MVTRPTQRPFPSAIQFGATIALVDTPEDDFEMERVANVAGDYRVWGRGKCVFSDNGCHHKETQIGLGEAATRAASIGTACGMGSVRSDDDGGGR